MNSSDSNGLNGENFPSGESRKKIAIIGSGVAGLTAAWLLHRKFNVTLFEKNDYLGGHTNTITVDDEGSELPVDTGFIVYNEKNYPNLVGLFAELDIQTQPTEMSFSFSLDKGKLEYSGSGLGGLFAQKTNWFRPSHWMLLREILRFNEVAHNSLDSGGLFSETVSGNASVAGKPDSAAGKPSDWLEPNWIEQHQFLLPDHPLKDMTLGQFLDYYQFTRELRYHYLLPMGAAIWSCPADTMLGFPAVSFLRFFRNHGLIDLRNRPQWRTVVGGSQSYVKAMLEKMGQLIEIKHGVESVTRNHSHTQSEVWIKTAHEAEPFDEVILACHADNSLALLNDADYQEQKLLGAFRYEKNQTYLHTDTRLMPRRQSVWSSWNYLAESSRSSLQPSQQRMTASYWMNRLQRLKSRNTYLVTLNPYDLPADEKIIKEIEYHHPVFDSNALQAQAQLHTIQGQQHTWFCGSYHRYGFHEDAVGSAVAVCRSLGVVPGWYNDTDEKIRRSAGSNPDLIERIASAAPGNLADERSQGLR